MEVNLLFLITGVLRPKNMYQLEHVSSREENKNKYKICSLYVSCQN